MKKAWKSSLYIFLLLLMSFSAGWADGWPNNARYVLYSPPGSEYKILMIDTHTGFVWRNVSCENTSVANCWEQMSFVTGSYSPMEWNNVTKKVFAPVNPPQPLKK